MQPFQRSPLDELVAPGLGRSPATADAAAAVQGETLEQLQQKLYPKGGQPNLAAVQQEVADKKAAWQRSQRHNVPLPDGGRKAMLLLARLDRYLMLREKEEKKRRRQQQGQQQQ